MTQTQEDIKKLADDLAASQDVEDLVSGVPRKLKLAIYLVGDSLLGLALIVPGLAVVVGWQDMIRVFALSGVFATAGGFMLTMFGIYKSKKN